MLLLILVIIVALVAASYLLALVSETFAYGLSRVVEAIFDFFEYKAALRSLRATGGVQRSHVRQLSYKASYSQAR